MNLSEAQIATIRTAIEASPTGKPDISAVAEQLNVGYQVAKRMISAARKTMKKPRKPSYTESIVAFAAAFMDKIDQDRRKLSEK